LFQKPPYDCDFRDRIRYWLGLSDGREEVLKTKVKSVSIAILLAPYFTRGVPSIKENLSNGCSKVQRFKSSRKIAALA
jgi:hypothetical protein